MKATEVQIGGEYEARITGENMRVRILAEKASGGWTALSLATKKKVHVPLARQLRGRDRDNGHDDHRGESDRGRGHAGHGRNDQRTGDQTCPEEEGTHRTRREGQGDEPDPGGDSDHFLHLETIEQIQPVHLAIESDRQGQPR